MNHLSVWKKALLGGIAVLGVATLFSGCHRWHYGGHHGHHGHGHHHYQAR